MNKFLNNDWHVVAQSKDLQQGKILKARLLGEDLVLWRSGDSVQAWQDRCPHRGASLARGWLKEDTLVCPYHGFAFNQTGQCVHVPAHPDQPPSTRSRACVQTYHIQERYGMLWVCLGTPQQDIPAFPEFDEPSYQKFFFGPLVYKSSPLRALENFIDVNHVPFVHEGILGNPDFANIPDYKVKIEADGIHISDVGVWQSDLKKISGEGTSGDAGLHILRPLTVSLRRGSVGGDRLIIFFTITPVDEEECIAWRWMFINPPAPEDKFNELTQMVLDQDVEVVESQRPRRLPLDLQAEFHVASDRATIVYRKWLKKLNVTFGTI